MKEKIYVATTVGSDCILGAAIAQEASEVALTQAYTTFQEEAFQLDAEYAPKSVNRDGWKATQSAWKTLFPCITIIQCFLHVFIKIRKSRSRIYQDPFRELATKLWDA